MTTQPQADEPLDTADNDRSTFQPQKTEHTPFADKTWEPILQSHCTFEPDAFLRVMQNLIRNPNIMSTHLFRADVLYDSRNDQSIISGPGDHDFSDYTKHMRKGLRPLYTEVPGFEWQQTYVRQLVPRNRQLDRDLVQSCHFYAKKTDGAVSNLIVYAPHVSCAEDMPWYHPKVAQVAFLHEHESVREDGTHASDRGTVSVHFRRFPDFPLDRRLERTALQLLNKIHKHARGLQAGYVKRGGHDQIVPQQRFQETYARLKAKYAKKIIENWAEETDPSKHVFEDLGIASFLIELWADMYDCDRETGSHGETAAKATPSKPKFPGFVDIGCGNGLLISILAQEGYRGWGFDARNRKTWQTFTPEVRESVKEMVLVPRVLHTSDDTLGDGNPNDVLQDRAFHSGIFDAVAQDGQSEPPFIVSNHADELTPWTPLLAYLNGSSFIAIPCCSHNLAGARFRAPSSQKTHNDREADKEKRKEQASQDKLRVHQAAETGSLKKPLAAKKMPSAYASLCDYVSGLANEVGFTIEKELLRIPSTRNACLLGRIARQTNDTVVGPDMSALSLYDDSTPEDASQVKRDHVRAILTRELNMPVEDIRRDWITRARQIAGKTGEGH